MAGNVFDIGGPSAPVEKKPEPKRRSKHRETLTQQQLINGQVKLNDLVDLAFETLREAMVSSDFNNAIRAAQITLDRAGYGPKQTVDINQTTMDLSNLSKDELAARAQKLADTLKAAGRKDVPESIPLPVPPESTPPDVVH